MKIDFARGMAAAVRAAIFLVVVNESANVADPIADSRCLTILRVPR